METKKFTDRRTDAEGYNIIRPFFKRAYKNKPSLIFFFCGGILNIPMHFTW